MGIRGLIPVKILVYNQQRDVPIRKVSVKAIVKDVLEHELTSTDEVSLYFVSTEEICCLHQEFFNDPSRTDCISFPLDETEEQASGYHILGEIFICPKTAMDYDERAVYSEITLYLVHGLLHLLGYDDIKEKQQKLMREAEARHMERLMAKKLLLKL
jgi:probable rRNA maturation factor